MLLKPRYLEAAPARPCPKLQELGISILKEDKAEWVYNECQWAKTKIVSTGWNVEIIHVLNLSIGLTLHPN